MENGPTIATHLMRMRKDGKLLKPSLNVRATMDLPYSGQESPSEYEKKEVKRLKSEIAAIYRELDNWDPEEVASRAMKSLKTELAVKKARLEECKARLSDMVEDQGKHSEKESMEDSHD